MTYHSDDPMHCLPRMVESSSPFNAFASRHTEHLPIPAQSAIGGNQANNLHWNSAASFPLMAKVENPQTGYQAPSSDAFANFAVDMNEALKEDSSGLDGGGGGICHAGNRREPIDPMKQLKTTEKTGMKRTSRFAEKLKCIECEFECRTGKRYVEHLLNIHKTTPFFANIFFKCQCGTMTQFVDRHKCDLSRFLLIRKEWLSIRRMASAESFHKTTKVRCPKNSACEMRPTSIYEMVQHLWFFHRENLAKIGICMSCDSCGRVVREYSQAADHAKECESRNYSIHRLSEDDCC